MSIIKRSVGIFKHNHVFTGWAGQPPYLYYKSQQPYTDGIDVGHVNLYGKCDICGKEFMVAKIHTDKNGKLYETELDRNLKRELIVKVSDTTAGDSSTKDGK